MGTKNPYKPNQPEWQLWENIESNEGQARAHASDSERSTEKAAAAREKAELYREALARLERDKADHPEPPK